MKTVSAHIPTLTTERLTLRAPQREDFDVYASIVMSDRAEYMERADNRGEAWTAFYNDIGSWILDDFGYWTVTETSTGTPVGFIGIAHFPAFPEAELGWMTTAGHEGQGYAYEGALAALGWAFGPRRLPTLVSYIDPNNSRSITLARRLGATHDEDAPAPDAGDLVYRHEPRAVAR